MIQIIIISIISISLIISLIFVFKFYKKYQNLKTNIKEYEDIGTGRRGFYHYGTPVNSYYSIVYVKEVDRYTDGFSKIQLESIEPYNKYNYNNALGSIKNSFISLKKTDSIDWLESEDHIKKVRKEKLENIKKI